MGNDLILANGSVVPVRDRRALSGQRDPRGATQLINWQSPELPLVQSWNAHQAWKLGVLANVIAYRCVQLRARACSSVPLVAGRKMGDAKSINDNAAIAKLLGPPPGGPAPKLSASKLIRWTMAQKIVTGRRAWEIETASASSDVPVAFWPLVSSELREKPSKGGTEWFRVFEYGRHDHPTVFRPDQVFYGWEPGGLDFRQAESELQSARFDLSLVTLCDQYGISFLRNNAVPAAIVTTTAFPTDEARRKFASNWEGEFGGPNNAGRVAINEVGDDGDGPVGDSIHVETLGLSAKDSKLIETRKAAMTEVAIALGVPWSKLDASGRTYENADAEDRDWWENTILPDLIDLQDDINMQLAPRLGSEVVWFDLREVRALQRKIIPVSAVGTAVDYVDGGIWTPNEARVDTGQEPLEDPEFDKIREAPTPPQLVPPTPLALPAGDPAPKADAADLNTDDAARSRQRRPEVRVMDPEQVEQRRAIIWRQSDAAVRTLEARWERAWRRMFARQEEATIARLTGKRGRQMLERRDGDPAPLIDPNAIFDPVFWQTNSAELGVDLYDQTVTASLGALAARFGISFDLHAQWVEDFIQLRSQQLAGLVTQTTYDQIRQEMSDAVNLGESIDDIARRIRAVFANADKLRSMTIARTEVISAYNGAAVQGAATLPADVVAGQEWIATRDSRTRESHATADGQVVAIGAPFDVGGQNLAYPGDPSGGPRNTINCRCAVAFLTPDEFAEFTAPRARTIEVRTAKALLALVPAGVEDFDFITWRRAAEEVAA